MNKSISKVITWSKNTHLLENLILLTSAISVNFTAYIAYFDINSLSIVDSTTVAKHVLVLGLSYVIISTVITITMFLIRSFFSAESGIVNYVMFGTISAKRKETLASLLSSKPLKYTLSTIIFMFVYVGSIASLAIIGGIIFYAVITSFFHATTEESQDNNNFLKGLIKNSRLRKLYSVINEEIKNKKYSSLAPKFIRVPFQLILLPYYLMFDSVIEFIKSFYKGVSNLTTGNILDLLAAKIGIFLVLFTFSLGVGRATYVAENVIVSIYGDNKVYSLYMATDYGVGLLDKNNNEVVFYSWGKMPKIIFHKDKQRSLRELFSLMK